MPSHYNPKEVITPKPKFGIHQIVYMGDCTKPYYYDEVEIIRIQIDCVGNATHQTDHVSHEGKQHWTYQQEDHLFATPKEAVDRLLTIHKEMLDSSRTRYLQDWDRYYKTFEMFRKMP